jgi:hypothetical protein
LTYSNLAHELIAGFNGRKRKGPEMLDIQFQPQNIQGHESVQMKSKRKCRVHVNNKVRKETVYGCNTCGVHLCKDGCHFQYHQ